MIENMPPKGTILSDFIRTFAILDSVSVGNLFIKEKLEYEIYHDFRKFIFTPSIYATTTFAEF